MRKWIKSPNVFFSEEVVKDPLAPKVKSSLHNKNSDKIVIVDEPTIKIPEQSIILPTETGHTESNASKIQGDFNNSFNNDFKI